jgi:hypothetical protein
MRRHAIGIISIVLLLSSVALLVWQRVEPAKDWRYALMGATVRVGVLMAVIWLAYSELKRLPAWMWGTLPILLAILAVRPRYLLIAVPVVIALAILKPRLPSRRIRG